MLIVWPQRYEEFSRNSSVTFYRVHANNRAGLTSTQLYRLGHLFDRVAPVARPVLPCRVYLIHLGIVARIRSYNDVCSASHKGTDKARRKLNYRTSAPAFDVATTIRTWRGEGHGPVLGRYEQSKQLMEFRRSCTVFARPVEA